MTGTADVPVRNARQRVWISALARMRVWSRAVPVALLTLSAAYASPPERPDGGFTPGVADRTIVQADIARTICVHGYTAKVRSVTEAEKRQVFAEYGIDPHVGGPYEIDHLISLEIGGANDVKNLWPQSYVTRPWNAHVKDRLENKLHALVCAGKLSLRAAQKAIVEDWEGAFKTYVQ